MRPHKKCGRSLAVHRLCRMAVHCDSSGDRWIFSSRALPAAALNNETEEKNMSEQTATRFQDLLDLLNLQDEDGASAAAP